MECTECAVCGRKRTDKNIRSFVMDLWVEPPIWRCNDMGKCRDRMSRNALKAASKSG